MDGLADMELIREYVDRGSNAAFEALLNRYVNLVYSAAMRQVRNPETAREITQITFIILAQKACKLSSKTIVSGWLYQTAQYAANRSIRSEMRRRLRENAAMEIQTESTPFIWEHLAPVLDQAMMRLGAIDRNAIVLRFFENKSSREVATALGVNEATAQKRVVRAIEKLRSLCGKKGVVMPAVALTALISANALQAAPIGTVTVIAASAKGAGMAGATAGLVKATHHWMAWVKFKWAAYSLAALTIAGGAVPLLAMPYLNRPKYENRALPSWMTQLDDGHRETRLELRWESWEIAMQRTPAQAEAAQAMRAMGTNALPYLISALNAEDHAWTKNLKFITPAAVQHREGMFGLAALGPLSISVIPELTRLLHGTNCPKEAAVALASIGPEGWEVLGRAIADTNSPAGACSIWALGMRRASVPGTVEAMIELLKNEEPGEKPLTGWALARIGKSPEEVVPLLMEGLQQNRVDCQWGCAIALGEFGPRAQMAVPALLELLKNREPALNHDAGQALQRINPAAAAAAGVTNAIVPHVPRTFLL